MKSITFKDGVELLIKPPLDWYRNVHGLGGFSERRLQNKPILKKMYIIFNQIKIGSGNC